MVQLVVGFAPSGARSLRFLCLAALVLGGLVPAHAAAATPIPKLADQLTSGNPRQSVPAVRDALTRGGITVRDGRTLVRRAVSPAAWTYPASSADVLNYAAELRSGSPGRVSVAELGSAWARAGVFPLRGRPSSAVMQSFLAGWVRDALSKPKQPEAFVPLLLDTLASARGVDLKSSAYDPASYRFSPLEVELLSAAFRRIPRSLVRLSRPRARRAVSSPSAHASASRTCTEVLDDYLKRAAESLTGSKEVQDTIKEAGKQQIEKLGEKVGPYAAALTSTFGLTFVSGVKEGAKALKEVAEAYEKAFNVMDVFMRAQKLAAFYNAVLIYIDPNTTTVEKPVGTERFVGLQAHATIKPDDQQRYEEALKRDPQTSAARKQIFDCAKLLGIPTPSFASDLGSELDSFRVRWSMIGFPNDWAYETHKTKYISGTLHSGALTRVDPTLAIHDFYVEIKRQNPFDPNTDVKYERPAYATVKLLMAKPPDPKLIKSVILSGGSPVAVGQAALDSIIGLIQSFVTPQDTATINIQFWGPPCQSASASTAGAAHAASYTPSSCGPLYASVSANITDRVTGLNCPDVFGSATVSGSANTLPTDTPDTSSTFGDAGATGTLAWIQNPWDSPIDPCAAGSQAFSGVPSRVYVGKIDGTHATISWGVKPELDVTDPAISAALQETAIDGFVIPITDGTYEFDSSTIGVHGSDYRHISVQVAFRDTP